MTTLIYVGVSALIIAIFILTMKLCSNQKIIDNDQTAGLTDNKSSQDDFTTWQSTQRQNEMLNSSFNDYQMGVDVAISGQASMSFLEPVSESMSYPDPMSEYTPEPQNYDKPTEMPMDQPPFDIT